MSCSSLCLLKLHQCIDTLHLFWYSKCTCISFPDLQPSPPYPLHHSSIPSPNYYSTQPYPFLPLPHLYPALYPTHNTHPTLLPIPYLLSHPPYPSPPNTIYGQNVLLTLRSPNLTRLYIG